MLLAFVSVQVSRGCVALACCGSAQLPFSSACGASRLPACLFKHWGQTVKDACQAS